MLIAKFTVVYSLLKLNELLMSFERFIACIASKLKSVTK